MKISTNWLKDFVELAPPVSRIAERLTLAGLEVKKCEVLKSPVDTVFEIEITSNRPDWLSHVGVAREIAAIENISLKGPVLDQEKSRLPPKGWDVKIKDAEGCPYYTGVLIEGITVHKTPDFIVDRLLVCGIRSINLIVDITNYVLLEVGQPLHAFDADLIRGNEIQLRKSKAGEKFISISGAELTLKPDDLVVADAERAIALAGVMGGKDTEITDRTRNVFLESAFFHPCRVRKMSRQHLLSSDSSYRFERRVDPEGVDTGCRRALWLIQKYGQPRTISSVVKAGEKPQIDVKSIYFRNDEVKQTLGVEVKPSQVISILTRLGLDAKPLSEGVLKVGIPAFRPDLTRPVDLVEEIARIYGYENIPETLPAQEPLAVGESPRLVLERTMRQLLSGAGFCETMTFSLISEAGLDTEKDLKHAVKIVNPLHHGLHWMRPTLVTSLLEVIRKNVNAGADAIPLFEIANIYSMPDAHKHPVEERVCAIMLYGKKNAQSWIDQARPVTFYDLKGAVENLLQTAGCAEVCVAKCIRSYLVPESTEELRLWQTPVALIGRVSPEVARHWDIREPVYYAEIALDKLLAHVRPVTTFAEWPRYPAIERDLSIVVKESVKCGDLMSEIRGMGQGLIRQVELFDLFRGKRVSAGCKNLAFRVVYQSAERTLVSDEVQNLHDQIAQTLVKKYLATFQG